MKLNSKIFSKSLILETNQMNSIKGGGCWTQTGSGTTSTGGTTRDFSPDSASTHTTWCALADGRLPCDNCN